MGPSDTAAGRRPAGQLIVFHPGALGDAIIASQTLRALAAQRGRPLVLAGRDYWRPLAEGWPFVARFVSLDSGPLAGLYQEPPLWPAAAAGPLETFEQALIFAQKSPNSLSRALNRLGLPALTLPSRPLAPGLSLARQQLGAAGLAGRAPAGPLKPPSPWLETARRWRERAGAQGRPPLLIHPGSGSRLKNWPAANFRGLAQKAAELGWPAVFLLGPGEAGRADEFSGWPVWPDLPLTTVAGLLSGAVYAGNDSGISHLAGLSGAGGVVVFGPTDPAVWRPEGLLEAVGPEPGRNWPAEAAVWAALKRFMVEAALCS